MFHLLYFRLEVVSFQERSTSSSSSRLHTNLVRFSSEVKSQLLYQFVRTDQSSVVKISNGETFATYRMFTRPYSSAVGTINCPPPPSPEYVLVTELTQIVIDSLCQGYKFLYLSSSLSEASSRSLLLDPILETALTKLLTVKTTLSSLLITTPVADNSFVARIKALIHTSSLQIPLLRIQVGWVLMESVRARCTLAAALRRTLRCCVALEPCVVLIEDLHLFCPPPGSSRFNTDPETYSDTAKAIAQFIKYCNSITSKSNEVNESLSKSSLSSSSSTSSPETIIKVIGLCQNPDVSDLSQSSALSISRSVACVFQETASTSFPDTATRRQVVRAALDGVSRVDISASHERALNAWADRLVGMSRSGLLAHTLHQIQLATRRQVGKHGSISPAPIVTHNEMKANHRQDSGAVISEILGSVSDVYSIKLRPVADPVAVSMFASISNLNGNDKDVSVNSRHTRSSSSELTSKAATATATTHTLATSTNISTSAHFGRIRGHEAAKREITQIVLWPRWFPQIFRAYRAQPATGVLLYGPPGTGKSLFPSVLASELGCHLVNIRLSDVVKGSIGSGERSLRETFAEAKKTAPSIIFIDEFQVNLLIHIYVYVFVTYKQKYIIYFILY